MNCLSYNLVMKKLRPARFLAIAICILVQFAFMQPNLATACPTCKDGLHADGTAFAYAVSILFMMAMPFLIMSFWIFTIIRLRSKAAQYPPTVSFNFTEKQSLSRHHS